MHPRRPAQVALLVLLYAVSGGFCLLGAVHPMNARTPVPLLAALAAVGACGAAAIWVLAERCGPVVLHTAVGLLGVLIGLLAWRSATAVGVVGLGPAVIATALYAAHYFRLPAARLHTLLLLGFASAGAAAPAPSGLLVQWLVLVVATAALAETQGRLAHALRAAAATDPLTGVANRRAWDADARRCLARATRTGQPLSVALLDLDDFKRVNDDHGHGAGDALLRELTTSWVSQLRTEDLLGRYGGDEFVLCLPGTDADGARELLDRLERSHPSSWTTGTATAGPGDTLDALLTRADADLYTGKRDRGRPLPRHRDRAAGR